MNSESLLVRSEPLLDVRRRILLVSYLSSESSDGPSVSVRDASVS